MVGFDLARPRQIGQIEFLVVSSIIYDRVGRINLRSRLDRDRMDRGCQVIAFPVAADIVVG